MSQDAGSNAPKDSVTLIDHSTGNELNMPLLEGTVGPKVIDICKLYSELDYFTFDPGFMATGSCDSKITYIDGDAGVLLYRGYRIEDLAKNCDFPEVSYLLLEGELPTQEEKDKFVKDITYHTMVHEQLHKFYDGFRRDAHPMAIMCGRGGRAFGILSRFHGYRRSETAHDRVAPHDRENADDRGVGLQIRHRPTVHISAQRFVLCRGPSSI